jgi:hypothetical protein
MVPTEHTVSTAVNAAVIALYRDAQNAGIGDVDGGVGRYGVEEVLDQLDGGRADVVDGYVFQDGSAKDRIDLGDGIDCFHGGPLDGLQMQFGETVSSTRRKTPCAVKSLPCPLRSTQ